MDASASQESAEKARRGYRACLHCRSRKAKCDLGDINAPSSPPCSRCKRESRECVFAPSKRGGNSLRRHSRVHTEDGDRSTGSTSMTIPPSIDSKISVESLDQPAIRHTADMDEPRTEYNHYPLFKRSMEYDRPNPRAYPSVTGARADPASATFLYDPAHRSPANADDHSPSSLVHSHPSSTPRQSIQKQSTPSPKRRRLHLNPPLHAADPSSIVVADMQNESDALQILALASGQSDQQERPRHRARPRADTASLPPSRDVRDMGHFPLIKLGIVSEAQTALLTERFFRLHHHFFPMVPSAIIPHTQEQLQVFAHNERYLLAAMIIITSRHDPSPGMQEVHDRSWAVMRGWLSDIQCLGAPPTIGLVEALLLLAENLPRDPARSIARRQESDETHALGFGEEAHEAENRQAWSLIGLAIRSAYYLGIDKLANKLLTEAERTMEMERARLAWTYCYLFDRHVSLRLGKAFWSRGPASVCFQGFSSSVQTGPAAASNNFPFLKEAAGPDHSQEDLASLVQAYLELTQLMSNAHDVLYPNAARTRSLVIYGEYFKYIDELTRSLDGFKVLWRQKKWRIFPLTDAVWAMFYYVQLYICAFSFQAHVERASIRADEEYNILEQHNREAGLTTPLPRPPLSLFPRGAAASPDARNIFQSCDAARTLLHICIDSLYPGGAVPYLPSRYLLWFTYAAILLLKALYSGAMLRADHSETLSLVDRLCECFASTSKDEDHPAVRYGRQLTDLRKKLASLREPGDPSSPTGGDTVPLPPMRAAELLKTDTPAPAHRTGSPLGTGHYANSPAWTLPAQAPPPAVISFPYPNPPHGNIPPPHQQPISEINSLSLMQDAQSMAPVNNLGFPTLEDWFGPGLDTQDASGGIGGLDLQDFWMKVGPGEAQGGFPFR